MTREEAIRMLIRLKDGINFEVTDSQKKMDALNMAIKSLEAWEKIKDQLSELVHHNLDVKENFEIGSTSRIECNTTASVLAGVIDLIDKHLSGVSE